MLIVWCVVLWLNLAYSTTFFLPPSRRLANYTFYAWTVAYNLSIITLFLLIELLLVVVAEKRVSFPIYLSRVSIYLSIYLSI